MLPNIKCHILFPELLQFTMQWPKEHIYSQLVRQILKQTVALYPINFTWYSNFETITWSAAYCFRFSWYESKCIYEYNLCSVLEKIIWNIYSYIVLLSPSLLWNTMDEWFMYFFPFASQKYDGRVIYVLLSPSLHRNTMDEWFMYFFPLRFSEIRWTSDLLLTSEI